MAAALKVYAHPAANASSSISRDERAKNARQDERTPREPHGRHKFVFAIIVIILASLKRPTESRASQEYLETDE